MHSKMDSVNLLVALAVLRRPRLWPIALVQLTRMAARGWWRRKPFLPRADPAYLKFRAVTQYGDSDRPAEPADVVAWLEWCRKVRP